MIALARHAPRDNDVAWREFWADVKATGDGGDVLWDASAADELDIYREVVAARFDPARPIVDLGCGNGRFTRGLADMCSVAVGVDVAEAAVQRAREESGDAPGRVEFLALDITDPRSGVQLRERFGECDVFVRGVLHVLPPAARVQVAATIAALIGSGGRVLIAETDFRAGSLAYLEHIGATPTRIPPPLAKAIAMLPQPSHFGAGESRAAFPRSDWEVVEERATTILTVPTRGTADPEKIPGYLAVLAHRA